MALAAANAHTAVLHPRVVGGQPVDGTKYNFVANIVSVDPVYTGKNCSGALITDRLVITTANCLMSGGFTWFNPTLMSVSFGPANTNIYKVYQAYISNSFEQNSFTHNVGLIMLASPVPASVATPVKIYSGGIDTSLQVFAAGYGLTGRSSNSYPNSAHIVPLSIMDHKNCTMYEGFDPTTQLCVAGARGGNLCMGDEGAPLLVANNKRSVALLGVASYITEPSGSLVVCGEDGGVVYFEVSRPWAQWISKVAHVTYNDLIISLNITTDKDHDLYSQVDANSSESVIEGPLPMSSIAKSSSTTPVPIALNFV
ncbi:hypothetical protein GGH16_001129, partial [Coemansia sp. RSA 560]